MVDRDSESIFFQVIHVRADMRIDISISIKLMNIMFGKQVHIEKLPQMRLIK